MKTLAFLFALSLSLLFPSPAYSAFNPIRLPTADNVAAASGTAVLDTDGDEVRAGGTYYITTAASGGVKLQRATTALCPSDVIMSLSDDGDRVIITPADPNATVVLPSTYQRFTFNVASTLLCIGKGYWRIEHQSGSGKDVLKADKYVSNLSDQFKIEVVDANLKQYKITYCEFGGADECSNVGGFFEPWWRTSRLALSDTPFVFSFKKAAAAS